MPTSAGSKWMGTREASTHLGVALRTVYRLIDEGDVPAYRLGRVVRLRRREVDACAERRCLRAAGPSPAEGP